MVHTILILVMESLSHICMRDGDLKRRKSFTLLQKLHLNFLIVYNNGKQARLTNSFTCNGKLIGDFEYDVNELSENSVSLSLKYSPLPKDFSKWKKNLKWLTKILRIAHLYSLIGNTNWKPTSKISITPHYENPYYEKFIDYCNKNDFKYFKEINNGLEIINKTMIVRKEKGVVIWTIIWMLFCYSNKRIVKPLQNTFPQ